MTTTIGLLAGVLTAGCWLPQLRRSWRTRSTTDISWTYLTVLTTG
jgi:MtN3 and saliva related transmembrane protein